MHFRHVDDEILFGSLKAQLFQSLQGAPTHMLTNVLRVLGRLESVAFYEGVRQGVVAKSIDAEITSREQGPMIAGAPLIQDGHPIALHASIYNAAFTPLAAAEERCVRLNCGADAEEVIALLGLRDGCLAATPLEMPPMTLAEALASPRSSLSQMAEQAPAPDPALLTTIFAAEDAAAREALSAPVAGFLPTSEVDYFEDIIAACGDGILTSDFPRVESVPRPANGDPAAHVSELLRTDGSKRVTEQPAFIERCRDVLQDRMATGWSATSWGDVVFAVRDELKADPYSIDIQLSTDIGKAMLRSIGLFEIADSVLDAESIESMLQPRAQATP